MNERKKTALYMYMLSIEKVKIDNGPMDYRSTDDLFYFILFTLEFNGICLSC